MLQRTHWNQRTKIVCTLGPGVDKPAMIERLIRAGMNVARINRSHSTMEEHAGYVRMVRRIAGRLGSNVAVLMDLPGPKYRTGEMKDKSAVLKKGTRVTLTNRPVQGDRDVIP
ncbi:MAG: pyruvate kinase, partial [Dehalococcoidales bacterium]|nr:pyruvate kinase [Dehalococcoidales bacterium]